MPAGSPTPHEAIICPAWQLLGILLESGSGVLRYKLLEEDDYGETALTLATRLGHASCKAVLESKIQQLVQPDESLIELVRDTWPVAAGIQSNQ